ncbi:MAG TPA: cupin domain-containing protein [Solirubrobacteraceae bacterium]|jgi:mannose-6-phosphate isomerase-like protein (cupin superfamily)
MAQASVSNIAAAPRRPLASGRGSEVLLFGEGHDPQHADMHVNILNRDSGPGQYHYHSTSENMYLVLEGILEICVEGDRYYLGRDDVAFVPPRVRHRAGTHPDSPVPARVLEVYAPPHPDFNVVEDPTEVHDRNSLEEVKAR